MNEQAEIEKELLFGVDVGDDDEDGLRNKGAKKKKQEWHKGEKFKTN